MIAMKLCFRSGVGLIGFGLMALALGITTTMTVGCQQRSEPSGGQAQKTVSDSSDSSSFAPLPDSQSPASTIAQTPTETRPSGDKNAIASPTESLTESDSVAQPEAPAPSVKPLLPSPDAKASSEGKDGATSERPDEKNRLSQTAAPPTETELEVDSPKQANELVQANDPVQVNEPVQENESVPPSEVAAQAFEEPTDAKRLSKRQVWVDLKQKRVYADGYIAMNDGPLEMFACPSGTKEHESIVATLGKASEIHAGLLAIGVQVGTPVAYHPRFVPATGQRIRVWVCYYDESDQFQVTDARKWIVKIDSEKTLQDDWVFAGSFIWEDPADGHQYYQGDIGDMICVSNFSTAMLDIPVLSSSDADDLEYSPYTQRIPPRATPVRLILEPIPLPSDDDKTPKTLLAPTAADLVRKSGGS